jgi:hypothetical protein
VDAEKAIINKQSKENKNTQLKHTFSESLSVIQATGREETHKRKLQIPEVLKRKRKMQ